RGFGRTRRDAAKRRGRTGTTTDIGEVRPGCKRPVRAATMSDVGYPFPTGTLELLRPNLPRGRFRAALFDFDRTLSLLRRGWRRVMSALMRDAAARAGVAADQHRLDEIIESIVVGLNGKPTIVQMSRFAEELAALGGRPATAADYAAEYQIRLL